MAKKEATELNVEVVKEAAKKATKATKKAVKKVADAAPEQVEKVAKKAQKATEKAAETVKKTAKKAATKVAKAEVVIQFAGREVSTKDILEAAKKDFSEKNTATLKEITLYVKPEDGAAYYVANGDITGKVEL